MSGLISPELYAQMQEMYLWYRHQRGRETDEPIAENPARNPSRYRPLAVISDESIGGTFLAPASGLVTLCKWNAATQQREQTATQLTVWNESGDVILPDTPGIAIPVDSHLVMFAACEPLEDRPAPPTGGA